MTRKKLDPRALALMAKIDKISRSLDRWWGRLRRAVTAIEKGKQQIKRAARVLDALKAPTIPGEGK